jgi:hypothetical protein
LLVSVLFCGQQVFKLGHPFLQGRGYGSLQFLRFLVIPLQLSLKVPRRHKIFQCQIATCGYQVFELKPLKYSSSWGITKLDPASSKNLHSWPPLISPKKGICFPPISFVLVGI